jgi:hypothetical protein
MARHKAIDFSPKLLPVLLFDQRLPGTFEGTVNHVLDRELDLCGLEQRYDGAKSGKGALKA